MNTYLIKITLIKKTIHMIVKNEEKIPLEFLEAMARDVIKNQPTKEKEVHFEIEELENLREYFPELKFNNNQVLNHEKPAPVEDSRM